MIRKRYHRAAAAAVAARLLEIAQHFEVMKGTCGLLRYNSEGQVAGRIGGYKEAFPEVKDLREAPAIIAKAIRRGKGKIFKRVEAAVAEAIAVEVTDHLSTVAHKAVKTRLQLAEWGACSTPSEAARKAWDTRRTNAAKKGAEHGTANQ